MIDISKELRLALASKTLAAADLEAHVAALPASAFQGAPGGVPGVVLGAKGPDPLTQLVLSVVNEQAALRQGENAARLAVLANATASAFTNVDQLALARRAQARAYDQLDNVRDAEKRADLARVLAIEDAEIARRSNNFAGAAAALPDIEALLREQGVDVPAAVKLAQRSSKGLLLHRQDRLAEALEIFTESEQLASEVSASLTAGEVPLHMAQMEQSQLSKYYNGYSNALAGAVAELEAGRASSALHALLQRNAQHWAARIEARTPSLSLRLDHETRFASTIRVLCLELLDIALQYAETIFVFTA